MSYARFSETSSVYVYADVNGYVACCGCILGAKWDYHSAAEIVAHLEAHVEAGHMVHPALLDPSLYDDSDFIPMCNVFMCRELEGHTGEHTIITDERLAGIRTMELARIERRSDGGDA